jgi:enoyl-CoA hydratase/carnithine racemase
MTESAAPVRVVEETPAYWRVLFDYPPFNIVDATMFEGLQGLLARMDASPNLGVVVFESANPEFYLAHFDLTGKTGNITTAVGPSGLPILIDTFVRLTKSPVVSIAKIRGCVRGVSSEFVLACDMRFASRENTLSGQPEVGVGVHPGGGGAERLPHLVGRGRALEIVLGSNDFDGDTAERYGYVNRALPDAELDGFVDVLARRIASFDRRPIAAAKHLINQVSLPSADRLLDALNAFQTALTWPETQQRIQASVRARTPAGRRLRESVAGAARHAPRDVATIIFTCSWRSCQESSIRCFTPPPVPLFVQPREMGDRSYLRHG